MLERQVMIGVKEATLARIKELAGEVPVSRYLSDLSKDLIKKQPATLADLILEVRAMGKELKLSATRMKILDIFLASAKPETLEFIRKDLESRLSGENPETKEEFMAEMRSVLSV